MRLEGIHHVTAGTGNTSHNVAFSTQVLGMRFTQKTVTKVLPWLTPVAAATHLRRHESPMVGINVVLLLLAAFVVVGRFAAAPV
jgi:catechol 2,3-dioxygenase-like lactoylglutathione lyase family enzyme